MLYRSGEQRHDILRGNIRLDAVAGSEQIPAPFAEDADQSAYLVLDLFRSSMRKELLGVDPAMERKPRPIFILEALRLHIPGAGLDGIENVNPEFNIVVEKGIG